MSKAKDYNSINWSEHFYLDDSSPSGLKWNINKRKAGLTAGSKQGKGGAYQGWSVELNNSPYKVHRIIMVLSQGAIDENMVVDHLDGNPLNNELSNLKIKMPKANQQNVRTRDDNTSGIKGVYITTNTRGTKVNSYWTASWYSGDGRKTSKHFPVAKYGHDQAKALAVAYRVEQISLLNAAGASYTERHRGLTPGTPPAISPVQPT